MGGAGRPRVDLGEPGPQIQVSLCVPVADAGVS